MIDVPVSDLISKDLRRWFKEKWVDVSRKDKDGKHPPCGRGEAKTDSKGYPKCRPSKKVSSKTPTTTRGISSKEKKAMTRRKRSKPQGVGGKPTVVKSIFDNISPEQARAIAFSMNSPFDYMEQGEMETPEVKTDGGGESCCESLFAEYEAICERHNVEHAYENPMTGEVEKPDCEELVKLIRDEIADHQRLIDEEEGAAWASRVVQDFSQALEGFEQCQDAGFKDDMSFYASADPFEAAWDSISKGRFHGYTRSNISDRPYRQAEHRVWDISRKVKRERTKRRYARNKSRGTVRPAMRRQLGAGGKRASTKR